MTTIDLPQENVFGHTKKLRLILQAVEAHSRDSSLSKLRILDYGCGNGSAVTRFLCQGDHSVVGIDIHPESIDYAKQHFGASECEFIVGDWSDLEAKREAFDVVLFGDVLEHVEQPHRLLSLASNALKPGGLILLSVPNGYGPFELESYLSRLPLFGSLTLKLTDLIVAFLNKYVIRGAWSRVVVADDVPYNEESGHVQFFSRRRILRLCAEAGFELQAFRNVSFLSGPYSNYLFAPSTGFCEFNSSIADWLPFWLVSAWLIDLRKPDPKLSH
jgi:2-polyprenyl-3-methyl-5-hydroxy-6-metoxy-1,4-benzoquinol methylase